MKELSFLFIGGLSIGMLYPSEDKIYAMIPLAIGIFFYYFEMYGRRAA